MSSKTESNLLFFPLITLAVIGSAAALAAAYPALHAAAKSESTNLVADARKSGIAQAQSYYQLATLLDPGNTAAFKGLALGQLALGQPEAALVTLAKAGQGSDVLSLRVRTLM